MQNNDKKYFIPVDGTPIEVSEEIYRAYYQPIWNTRYHAQKNGECRCTKAQLWKCDGVCPGCPFYAAGKKVSIDTPIGGEEDEFTLGDTLADDASSAESILLLMQVSTSPAAASGKSSRWCSDALRTSGSMSRCSMAGRKTASTSGTRAVRKPPSGSLTSPRRTAITRP